MRRELKFRAWVGSENTDFINWPSHYEYDDITLVNGKYADVESGWDILGTYENVPVEQYTGLKDRNGKEIYEGDIVKYKLYADSRLDYIDEVFYSTISGAFMVGDEDNIRTLDCLINVEVIGNIHEPPKDFRPEHLKRMGVSISKGGEG